MIATTRIEAGFAPPDLMPSVQSVRDPIQRTTGGARGAATRRPAEAAQLTVDLDALFGAAPVPPAEPSPRRTEQPTPLPARSPAKSRSHIAIAGLLIGVAGLIALYVQLYSLNTERESTALRPASAPSGPQAILSAPVASRGEPVAAPVSEPTKAPIEENPALRSLLAADRQAPRPPRPAAETIGATASAPPATALETLRSAPVPSEPVAPSSVAPPPATSTVPPTVTSPAPTEAGTPAPATAAAASITAPVPQAVALADPTPSTAKPAALVPLSRPQPAFPQQALRDRVAGRVIARITVGTDGAVTAVQIESSTPPRVFDRAAVAALRQWRYAPIDQPQQATIELDFKLE